MVEKRQKFFMNGKKNSNNMPLLFSSTIALIDRELKKIDRVFKPQIRDRTKNLLGGLNMPYAGFFLGDPWTIPLDRYKTIITMPDPAAISLGPDIIIRDYTKKPRERTKNLFNMETGRFTLVHIPNLITKFLEDNEHIFNCRDQDVYETRDRGLYDRTSKNIRDRFADMFGAGELQGVSEDDPLKVLSLDLRKRLWESWKAGNNQINDIYRIVRRYEGFDIILPESVQYNSKPGLSQEISPAPIPKAIDEDNFNWKTGKYENKNI